MGVDPIVFHNYCLYKYRHYMALLQLSE